MLGKVRKEADKSGAGRLIDLYNTPHDFSFSSGAIPRLNTWVQFDPTSRGSNNLLAFGVAPAPREGGEELIKRIAKTWKSKAQDDLLSQDSVERYYVRNKVIEPIEDGSVSLILGRKGSGKTAIVKHFESKSKGRYNRYVIPIDFSKDISPSINQLLSNFPDRSVDLFRTFWSQILWITVANHILKSSDDKLISSGYKTQLKAAMGSGQGSLSVKAVGSLALNATLLYFGMPAVESRTQEASPTPTPDIERISEIVYGVVTEWAMIHVFIDELDRDFTGERSDSIKCDIIKGLIEAATDIRRTSASHALKVIPVVLLRDDVYHFLPPSSDKHSWLDNSVRLEWSDDELREMIGFRILKERILAKGGKFKQEDKVEGGGYFDSNWLRVFEENVSDIHANFKEKSMADSAVEPEADVLKSGEFYQHKAMPNRSIILDILSSSFRTPREIVIFVSHAAQSYMENLGHGLHINYLDFKNAKISALRVLKEQVRSEVYDGIPEIDQVLNIIKRISEQDLVYENWKDCVTESLGDSCNVEDLTNRLYQFSLIGYRRGKQRVFSYLDSDAIPFAANLKLLIHSGLWASCKPQA